MNKTLSLFMVAILLLTAYYAQNNHNKEVIKDLGSLIEQRFPVVAPGCVILVVNQEDTLYKKAFGTADIELNVSMKPDVVFRIGFMQEPASYITAISIGCSKGMPLAYHSTVLLKLLAAIILQTGKCICVSLAFWYFGYSVHLQIG